MKDFGHLDLMMEKHMIFEDDRGNVVDFFDKLPDEPVVVQISGGIDSAVLLYCTGITYKNKSYKSKIHTIHGINLNRSKKRTWPYAENVVNWIKDHIKSTNIEDLYAFPYYKTQALYKPYHVAAKEYYKRRYNISRFLDGFNQWAIPMPNDPHAGFLSPEDIAAMADHTSPFGRVDKKFLAYQCKKYGLHELTALTWGCITDRVVPCQNCIGCIERRWGFGTYDGVYMSD